MTIVPTITEVMVDCRDPEVLAGFWAKLLGVEVRNRLGDQYVWLTGQEPNGYRLAFQRVPDPTPGKNRLHVDGECADLDALTERVRNLGGSLVEQHTIEGFRWNVYADPEENVFCFGSAT